MPNSSRVIISPRDEALFKLLGYTAATKQMVLKASRTFPEPFSDERRVRERLQTLAEAGYVRAFTASAVGGLSQYYKLTPQGFQLVMGSEAPLPARSFFSEIAASRFVHTMILAEIIVHLLVAAHSGRVTIERFHRENELSLEAAGQTLVPDYQLSLSHAGKWFHFLFEVDNSTEPLNSFAEQSIKNKLLSYDTYQDGVLSGWSQAGRPGARPAFRVVFFTKTAERAEHILSLAHDLSRNRDRRLFVAVAQDTFLAEPDALRQPILLDHFGNWLPMVTPHDTAQSNRPPIRLRRAVAPSLVV